MVFLGPLRVRVGVGALTADRKATTMTETLVAADLHLALDVLADLTTEVALDPQVSIDDPRILRSRRR